MDSLGTCKHGECTDPIYSRASKWGFCYTHYRRDYHQRTKEKRNQQAREWRERNPEYWRNKDQEKKRAADKRYADKNREVKNENERLRRIAKADAIALERRSPAGRDRIRRASHARRAREAGVDSESFTDETLLEVYGTDCYICLEPIDLNAPRHVSQGAGWERGLHREHVIPISKGGPNTLVNCRPSHALCNLKKSDKV